MWVMMKGEGTEDDPDSQHLLAHCLDVRDVEVLELITPEVSTLSEFAVHGRSLTGLRAKREP